MIKNFIFDFDGTVADTIGGIVATMQETYRLHGREIPTVDDIKGVIGQRLDDCMRGLGIADEDEVTKTIYFVHKCKKKINRVSCS